jgi:hypothetical protein
MPGGAVRGWRLMSRTTFAHGRGWASISRTYTTGSWLPRAGGAEEPPEPGEFWHRPYWPARVHAGSADAS